MNCHVLHAFLASMALMTVLQTQNGICEWLDPGDMLHYDSNTKTMARDQGKPKDQGIQERANNRVANNEMCPTAVPAPSCQHKELHFYKRYIRGLLAQFMSELHLTEDLEEMQFSALMKLSASEFATLKSYVSPGSKVAIHDVDEILMHLIKNVRLHQGATEYGRGISWLDSLWEQAQDKASMIFAVLACYIASLIFRQLSLSRAVVLGLALLFIVGCVYEGINMYQKLEAEKFAEREKLATIPEHCNPEAVSFFRRIGWSLQVNVFGMDDPCKKFYELHMVDTCFQINPIEVATSVLGKVFETMARFLGSSFGLFYSKAMAHFNFFEKLIFVIAIIIVFSVGVMYMGPALVFSIPSLMRSVRRGHGRDMVEDVPQARYQPIQPPKGGTSAKSTPAVETASCSKCGNCQSVNFEQAVQLRSSPNRITITSGNKHISIEDIEPVAIESPGARVEACAAVRGSSSEDNPPESLSTVSSKAIDNS